MAEAKKYVLTPEQEKQYQGILVLHHLINSPATISVLLDAGESSWLETVLQEMHAKDYVDIKPLDDGQHYVPTAKGQGVLRKFMQRYGEYLQTYDLYCAIDTGAGEFAFARYYDFGDSEEGQEQWDEFFADDRWIDLRIAVAEFKGLNPFEIVFMSFLNEERFRTEAEGWQFDLVSGAIWTEITEICQSAWKVNDLAYDDVSGEDVIKDIIEQGTALTIELIKKVDELEAAQAAEDDEEDDPGVGGGGGDEIIEVITYVEEVDIPVFGIDYYDPFCDPYYVSPYWDDPWYW
jgi:hypothetical protein